MKRFAILSNDGKSVINVIIASSEFVNEHYPTAIDGNGVDIGWVKNDDGTFKDPNEEVVAEDNDKGYAVEELTDDMIAMLLEAIEIENSTK